MDDVSTLGPLWVNQLRKEVATSRNRAEESLMTVNPNGAYAEQHRLLILAADTMLAAPDLLGAACQALAECADLMSTPAGDALESAIAQAIRSAA